MTVSQQTLAPENSFSGAGAYFEPTPLHTQPDPTLGDASAARVDGLRFFLGTPRNYF